MGFKLSAMLKALTRFAGILLITAACGLRAEEPIFLENADSSAFRILGDSTMTYLYGIASQVHLRQGQSDIKADSVFFSSNGYYRFMGDVKFSDSTRTITTGFMSYKQAEDVFRASGLTHLYDFGEGIRLSGRDVRFDNENQILIVTDSPFIAFNFDDLQRMIEVKCDSLLYYAERKYAEAFGNVEIMKGNLLALCGEAVLLPDSGKLVLTQEPKAYQRDNTVFGDSMTIFLVDDLIDRIEVPGHAEAVYKQKTNEDDTLFTESRLDSKKITFLFEDEELTDIISAGNSYSEYIPVEDDTLASGRNIASGDSIKLHFNWRRLTDVEIITSCEGKFFSAAKKDSSGNVIQEDTINYKADRLKYIIGENRINLYGSGQVQHQTVTLESEEILFNTESKILRANSVWETTNISDSLLHPVMLRDGSDEIIGERMTYNVETRRGKIKEADTEMEKAFYHGKIIRKEGEDVLLVDGGKYIPCEYRDANFYFYSKNMKLIENDRVIARPIVLYIEKIPVFYLPYFVFSIKKQRHSGFLPFQIGNFERGSRFVNNLGYYWALSDYYDLQTSIDYNDEVGLTFNAGLKYALRYKFSGSVSGKYSHETSHSESGESKAKRWQLNMSHKQTLSETASLNGSGSFVSDAKYITDISTDPDERLNRSLRSQLNFSKRWGRTSLTAVVEGTKNLDTDNTTYKLPNLSLSLPSQQIFASDDRKEENKRWYETLYLSYGVSSNNYISNSMTSDSVKTSKHYANIRHSMSLSMPLTVLRYLTLSPSTSIQEYWFYIFDTDQSRDRGLLTETGLRQGAYTFSLNANTTIYGMFKPPISGLMGLRHVLTPSLSFSYRPKTVRHEDEASFAGVGGSSTESQTLNLSLGNLFQIKYKQGEQEKKLDLFTLSFSSSYNFKSESYKWSNLNTSLRSSTIPHLTFTANASHDLYNRQSGKLDILGAHLTSLSFSTSFNYSGRMKLAGAEKPPCEDCEESGIPLGQGSEYPWQISIGHRYSETRGSGYTYITHWITTSSGFHLTPNWKVSFTQNYDIKNKELTDRSLQFYRDMRCWEAVFYWIPNGSRKGYYFRIGLKQIPDIKFEKSESGIRGALQDLL
jgi:lipopolysaccharide assembly outer membrane protein LptD (OstA)